MVVDRALVAADVAAAHCSTAPAIQGMQVGHSRGREVADAAVAGTDQGVVRRMEVAAMAHCMEVVVVARHSWGMAVSTELSALVGSILPSNHSQVQQHRGTEHEVVVMDCADLVYQKSSSA